MDNVFVLLGSTHLLIVQFVYPVLILQTIVLLVHQDIMDLLALYVQLIVMEKDFVMMVFQEMDNVFVLQIMTHQLIVQLVILAGI